MKKLILIASVALTFFTLDTKAQSVRCASDLYRQQEELADPSITQVRAQIDAFTQNYINQNSSSNILVTIPVVFHVVYQTAAQNLSDTYINAQLAALNKDYAKLNSDTGSIPVPFKPIAANTEVQFCLAQRDPAGVATTGITRTSTTVASFSTNNAVKYTAQGGKNIWDRTKYLNIWICNLGSGLLGYAQFPGGAAATDGVVVHYGSVGSPTVPNPYSWGGANYNWGRTGTHEVGHWLNLYHTFQSGCTGSTTNNNCLTGGDKVCDTPPVSGATYGCPVSATKNTCTETSPFPAPYTSDQLDQWMNYMDYTDDDCMYMFSLGQKARMQALFVAGGSRVSLTTSNGCVPLSINEHNQSISFEITPNPSSGIVNINLNQLHGKNVTLKVFNVIGQKAFEQNINGAILNHNIDLSKLNKGVYEVVIEENNSKATKKLVIQ